MITARSAVISECGVYRYRLFRSWGDRPGAVLWIMLNPSTADAMVDDPTIRRCMGFSMAMGYQSMWVGNLYAFRATDPDEIRVRGAGAACRGPENSTHLQAMSDASEAVICAWGASIKHLPETLIQVPRRHSIFCLGKTRDGSPRHPLYLPANAKVQTFSP